jgi:hypothetical protein
VFFYLINVTEALAMAKASYNCTMDSMMMQLCHNPFGGSVPWAILQSVVIGFPFIILWLLLGLSILIKQWITKTKHVKHTE